MAFMNLRRSFSVVVLMSAAASACQSSGDDVAADEAAIQSGACGSSIEDLSGEGRDAASIVGNDDLVAKMLLRSTDGCPLTFREVVGKLHKAGCGKGAMLADVVSERSTLIGKPEGGRVVLFPRCNTESTFSSGSEEDAELVLAPLQSVRTEGPVGDAVEMIAHDKTAGVFNFYAVEGRKWRFFGDSRSMLKGPGKGEQRRCASCHASGGLVMKELESPWMNWDSTNGGRAPGIDDVRANLAKNLDLPEIKSFSNPFSRFFALEQTVTRANEAWNAVRVDHLVKSGTLAQLLEPVFCDKELNLGNGEMPLVDEQTSVRLELPRESLAKVDAAAKTAVKDRQGNVLAQDTVRAGFHAEHARTDLQYAELLIERKLVTQKLVTAIRRVDPTRSVLSDERCSLVASVPSVDLESTNVSEKVDAAFAQALAGKANRSAPENELLRNLQETEDAARARSDKFFDQCAERLKNEPDALALDFETVMSAHRNRIRKHPIAEAPELLPFDSLGGSERTKLSVDSCKLH
jgi:hypothetical protein